MGLAARSSSEPLAERGPGIAWWARCGLCPAKGGDDGQGQGEELEKSGILPASSRGPRAKSQGRVLNYLEVNT